MYFSEPKTLIVIYKNEMLVNQLKKLIYTNDDIDEDNIVGVKDGSVRIVAWTEEVWKAQKKAGNISNKVLFLGDFKDTKALVPIMDTKFDQYGIKYGWAGNQALIVSDPNVFSNSELYNEFLSELEKYPLPDGINPATKEVVTKELAEQQGQTQITPSPNDDQKSKKKFNLTTAIGKTISFAGKTAKVVSASVSQTLSEINSAINDLPADRNVITTQQYFFAIMKFYENHMEEYLA